MGIQLRPTPVSLDQRVPPAVLHCAVVEDLPIAAAFDDVYRAEYPGLVAVAAAMTGDRDGAQDLVHDAMVRAWIHWDRVRVLDRPGAWCHRVLMNVCRSRLRRRATEWRYLASRRRGEPTVAGPSADAIAFWSAARTLPARPRAVVALYFAADLNSRQIGEILDIPDGTVRSDLSAARKVIMTALRGSDV